MIALTSHTPKWRRTSKPKTRTGCLKCRQRRLKCDELRPGCLRCSKANFVCSGYGTSSLRTESTPKVPRSLLQKLIPHRPESPVIPMGGFSTENEIDGRYINHFLKATTTGFEGMMDWTIWNHVLMQFSQQEPFVRDLIAAIGALTKSFETTDGSGQLPTRLREVVGMAKMHKEFALLKYGKAVKSMQSILFDAEPRQILIACLLVFFFEMLLNNRHPALSHLVSGHRLLRGWLTQAVSTDESSRISQSVALEDELVEAFEHLDLQICTIYDNRPVALHQAILKEGLEAVQQMPPNFNDLVEARRYLNRVMIRCHHFLATTWEATDAASLSREFFMHSSGNITVTTGFNIFSTTRIIPDTLPAEQMMYTNEHSRWTQAFLPLFESTRSPQLVGSRKFLVATLMQIHGIATEILLAGVLFTEECSYDALFPKFHEMLDLIHIIVDAYQRRGDKTCPSDTTFSLDLGITPPLFLLLLRCRDRQMRRHAIAILKGWHAEVCWHPQLIAEFGSFLLEIEEDGCAEGPIPETSRAVITRVCEAPSKQGYNEALVQFVQRHGGPDGEPVWREKTVTYTTSRTRNFCV